jgi:predicted SAM-dependent methyltransferase
MIEGRRNRNLLTDTMIIKATKFLKTNGIKRTIQVVSEYINPPRAQIEGFCQIILGGKKGLEIGGPSSVFSSKGILPIYDYLDSLNNCNFGHNTIWQQAVTEGLTYRYSKKKSLGFQYVSDATNLQTIENANYDCVLSSHVIEHIANPLLALSEWKRVLRENGTLVLIVPHKEGTFDHCREITSLQHLIQDFENNVQEDDLTHLPEIISTHDLSRDLAAGSIEDFTKRSQDNYQNRCLHHHVFDFNLVIEMLDYFGFQLSKMEACKPYHLIAIATKLPIGISPDNNAFKAGDAEFRLRSPFTMDQEAYR